jgi:hypothetical protein
MEQLLETWINGNRKDVVEYLLTMKKPRAIHMAVRLALRMTSEDREVFLKLIENRMA